MSDRSCNECSHGSLVGAIRDGIQKLGKTIDIDDLGPVKAASAEGPPPLGLHILMGNTAPVKVKNVIENISGNLIAPVEIIAEKSTSVWTG